MANMFDNAKKTEPKATGKTKGKKKAEVEIDGLEALASVKALITALETIKESLDAEVKDQMVDHFITEGTAIGRRPENFNGIEGTAKGSMQLRVRSSRSKLSEDEQARLEEAGVEFETITDVEDTFIINPEHAGNGKLLEQVSKSLEKVKGIPEDFILHQEGVERKVANEDSLNKVFTLAEEQARELLPVVGTFATRVSINETDPNELFQNVADILGE